MGGRTSGESAKLGDEFGTIPARALPEFLVEVVNAWKAARKADESFNEWLDRCGADSTRVLVERFSSLPGAEAKPEFYRDWGVDEPFSLAGRGAGECGAGVFEVIAGDIAEARRLLGGKESGPVGTAECRDGVLAATRALLVVHGVDSRDSDVILREFENRFIETRLVDAAFRDLVVRTRALAGGWKEALNDMAPLARALVDRIDVLFGTLDAELKFHPPEATPAAKPQAPKAQVASASASTATKELDLSGVACPMNFVKARIVLEDMQAGERLAVRLDDGEPIQNVPASFRNEGQEVEDVRRVEGGGWRAVILKKN
jgi:sulfite reductase (ferredoxin)